MSKVINLGIIIRNQEGDTFPVSLTPEMVMTIQKKLIEMSQLTKSALVDSRGNPVRGEGDIDIIPRIITFDWDFAYSPLERVEEVRLRKILADKYKTLPPEEEAADNVTKLHPERKKELFSDPDNPFNLELDSTGKANKDMTDKEVAEAMIENDKEKGGKETIEEPEGETIENRQDVVVEPPPASLGGGIAEAITIENDKEKGGKGRVEEPDGI